MRLLLAPQVCHACGTHQWAIMPSDGVWVGAQCGYCSEMAADIPPGTAALPLASDGFHAANWATNCCNAFGLIQPQDIGTC